MPVVRTDGRSGERKVTWLPTLLDRVDYHIFLGLRLRSRALRYYSFKIFLLFQLAKISRKIHHNQLLYAIYWTDDVKSAAKLQTIEPLTEKTWGEVDLFW